MAISLLRILCMSCGPSGTMSLPRQRIRPSTMRPGGVGMSLSTDIAVTDLPQPDSPTKPNVSPRSTARSTPSTACTVPSSEEKCVFNPRISSKRSAMTATPLRLQHLSRVEGVAQSVADEVDRQHGEKDRGAGKQCPMRRDVEVVLGIVEKPSPGGNVRREAEAKERQRRLRDDRGGDFDHAGDDHRAEGVGQDVAHHLARR